MPINPLREQEIIEKIDIGGISLIRAAAKNYKDVVVISSNSDYLSFSKLLEKSNGTTFEQRKQLATTEEHNFGKDVISSSLRFAARGWDSNWIDTLKHHLQKIRSSLVTTH